MSNPNIDLNLIYFKNVVPEDLPDQQWEQLWDVRSAAFSEGLKDTRGPKEIARYLGTPESFRSLALDPQLRVSGGRFNPNQTYKRPRLLIAYAIKRAGDLAVGFAYTADNVSGATEEIRRRKELTRVKNYRTITETAVHPEHQGKGVGLALLYGALRTAKRGQRVTAYVFPDELPKSKAMLVRSGAVWFGADSKHYFGEDAQPVQQEALVIPHPRREAKSIGPRSMYDRDWDRYFAIGERAERQFFPPITERAGDKIGQLIFDEGGLLDKVEPIINKTNNFFTGNK